MRYRGTPAPTRGQGLFLVAAMLLLSANLRPPLTAVSPVLAQIRADFGLSAAQASLLTALPVLIFGLGAWIVTPMLRRMGMDRTILTVLAVLLVGSLFRLVPSWSALLIGTVVLSAAIAVGNVVLPVLAKTRFPQRVGSITGLYVMSLNVVAAAAAGTVIPLAAFTGQGWRGGFAIWIIPIGVALIWWVPLASRRRDHRASSMTVKAPTFALLRNPRARAIVIFTASQSVVYYGMIAWLPSIFQGQGVSPSTSGILLFVAMLVGAPVALIIPMLAVRTSDQRALVLVLATLAGIGLGGLLLAPVAAPYLWVVLLGIGQGGVFPLVLTLFVLRTATASQTAGLSVLSQSTAYVLAAFGPVVMGVLHDRTGSWTAPIMVLLGSLLIEALSGFRAGKAGRLSS